MAKGAGTPGVAATSAAKKASGYASPARVQQRVHALAAIQAPAEPTTLNRQTAGPQNVGAHCFGAASGYAASSNVSRAVRRLNGGAPLPPTTRQRMEQQFGRSFESVSIHTDAAGADLAQGSGADAVTLGSRVAFAPGMFRPGTSTGDHLIAHELAHVAQQGSPSPLAMHAHVAHSQPSEPAELSAEHAASAASRGEHVGVSPSMARLAGGVSSRLRLMRQARAGALPMLTDSTPVPGTGETGVTRKKLAVEEAAEPQQPEARNRVEESGVFKRPQPVPSAEGKAIPQVSSAQTAAPATEGELAKRRQVETTGEGKPLAAATHATAGAAEAKSKFPASTNAQPIPAETKPGEVKPIEAKASDGKAGEAKASEVKASEGKAGEAKASEGKAGEAKAGEVDAGPGAPAAGSAAEPVGAPGGGPTAGAPAAATEEGMADKEAKAGSEGAAAAPTAEGAAKVEQSPRSPGEDPAFQATLGRVKAVAERQGHNNPANTKAQDALGAAAPPGNEAASQSKAAQVDKMSAQEPGAFNADAFESTLLAKIAELTPQTFKDADEFKKSGRASQIKNAVSGSVKEGKQGASKDISSATEAAPDPSAAKVKDAKPLPPTEAGAPPPDVGAEAAVPKPRTEGEVTMERDAKALDQPLADANITEEQLQKSNEPTFTAAVEGKDLAQKDASDQTQGFRASEQATIAGAKVDAVGTATQDTGAMHDTRVGQFGAVVTDQQQTKTGDEKARSETDTKIEGIYSATKERVEARLSRIDTDVDAIFDKGADQAKADFENRVDHEVFLFKLERYLGSPIGLALLAKDLLLGPPPEINNIYAQARQGYVNQMRGVIREVAQVVATGLNEAKGIIAGGLQEIASYVASLPEAERALGEQAAKNIQGRFDDLRKQVDQRRDQLVDRLAQKYVDNLKAIDDDIAKRQEQNRGLVDKAKAAIQEVIDTIKQLKEMLLGVLAKAAAVVEQIIKDPIGFLSNLVSGVGQGLKNFVANIAKHLQQGFMDWLFGEVAKAGIKMPDKFDLAGIFSLVAQVLGLTYANIRKRAVGILGEPMVARLEQAAEIFKILVTKGVAGVWEFIKDKVGDLKTAVVDGIKDFIIQKVIIGGIQFLLSLLSPASAFVKAVKMIIDIVMFIINRGAQIMEFVNAILDSLAAIASGSVGAVASAVEGALARAVPVAIGFLASLLGLGGLGDKIRSVIEKIQEPVNKAIDFLISLAVKAVKAVGAFIGGLFGGKKKEEPKPADETDPKKAAKVAAATSFIHQEEAALGEPDKIDEKGAKKVVAAAHRNHDLFKSISVARAGAFWEYDFVVNPPAKVLTPVADGTTDIHVKRSAFRKSLKDQFLEKFPNFHSSAGRLKADLDRRHKISSDEMAKHYEQTLNGKPWSVAKATLEKRPSPSIPSTVAEPLSNETIQEAAQARHREFFNDLSNLWPGGASENRSIGAAQDFPKGASPTEIEAHISAMYAKYGLK